MTEEFGENSLNLLTVWFHPFRVWLLTSGWFKVDRFTHDGQSVVANHENVC